jgi:hypothetical protein
MDTPDTHMWDVTAVCDVSDASQGHLLCEGLTKAGQALADLARQQGGSTTWIDIVLNYPLKGPTT